eukprot:Hpha_TRINITY_DN16854_c3_g2::TRINITY_DN16854_c3_g2_i4::g.150671::m.150671
MTLIKTGTPPMLSERVFTIYPILSESGISYLYHSVRVVFRIYAILSERGREQRLCLLGCTHIASSETVQQDMEKILEKGEGGAQLRFSTYRRFTHSSTVTRSMKYISPTHQEENTR